MSDRKTIANAPESPYARASIDTSNGMPHMLTDEESRKLYTVETHKHRKPAPVRKELELSSLMVVQTGEKSHAVLKDKMGEEDLLKAVLEPGEKVLVRVKYNKVDFRYDHSSIYMPPDASSLPGQVIITSNRLIFLSSVQTTALELDVLEKNEKKDKPTKYNVTHSVADALWYYPIPIECMKHVQVAAIAAVSTSSEVFAVPPRCWCCPCFGPCCSLCRKHWEHKEPMILPSNPRTIIIEMLHPAWRSYRMTAVIDVQFEETLPNMCNFVTVFQRKLRDPKGVAVGPAQEDME